jgi:hypothetical protein
MQRILPASPLPCRRKAYRPQPSSPVADQGGEMCRDSAAHEWSDVKALKLIKGVDPDLSSFL